MEKEKNSFKRPSDSLFTHLLARPISAQLTPFAAKTPITPLQVTILSLIFGLLAAWTGSYPHWLYGFLAALLMEFSHVLDCVDGELARLTGRGNPFAASLDPISDRIKDMAVLFSAYLQAVHFHVFNLSQTQIFSLAFLTMALWFLYMYIVDAYLNPAIKRKVQKGTQKKPIIYLGLYDIFIYGSILFWIFQIFGYFLFFILFLSILCVPAQIFRLKKYLL